jgi:hypothetical protein
MGTTIQVGGVLSLLAGVLHLFFPRFFDWRTDLAKLTPLNARILFTIHLFLAAFFFIFGFISLRFPAELAGGSGLGGAVAGSYAVFWLVRGVWQYLYFDPSGQPRGLKVVHHLIPVLSFLGTYLYGRGLILG